jgi:uncharacterized 2Fe-2S/4Fe-4S cluster protein (DUF4445 family)
MNSGKTVTVEVEGIGGFTLTAGENLRAALRREGVVLDGACRDLGTCGRCVVRVTKGAGGEAPRAGEAGAATAAEAAVLRSQGYTSPGHRLACRIVLSSDLTVAVEEGRLLEVDRAGRWKESWGSPLWRPQRFPPGPAGLPPRPSPYGVAFDLGTTSLAAALFDLQSGQPLDVVSRANPQLPFGADVLTRLQAADAGTEAAPRLRDAVRNGMKEMLRALASRSGVSPGQVGRAVAVGNSAMRQLVLGRAPRSLLQPPFSPADPGPATLSFAELGWEGRGEAFFPPVLGGFVGSDALAALLAAGPGKEPGFLLDIGTNCELLGWRGDDILAASAPAGPAFEGGHISRGMRAEEGAVFRVRLTPDRVLAETIGGGKMLGVCGTGIVDAAAELLRLGLLDRRGLMRAGAHPALSAEGLDLGVAGRSLLFTPADLATLQKAKAAVAAGLDLLSEKLGRPATPRVLLAGAFGSRLDLASASRIGMLPPLDASRFLATGNAALVGAAFLLLSPKARAEAERLAARVQHVSLAEEPAFEERYLDALRFPEGGRG